MKRALPCLLLCIACSSDQEKKPFPDGVATRAIADYKQVVLANYEEALVEAKKLESAINTFTSAPSMAAHESAKQAWVAARKPYGPSEAFRFYDGPIDAPEGGPEGLLNGWPLDENYIDYTRDEPAAGIINDPARYPMLTAEVLSQANEAAGEKAIATGFHAIEFLLWGQDDATAGTGAGKRPYTDYVLGGTAQNQERRKTYLTVVTSLLVKHLESVTAAWRPGAPNFAGQFGVGSGGARKDAIARLLGSLGSMAKAELSGERMTVAYLNRFQEDEHSCFSDNTAADLFGNGVGLQNVWLGRYGSFEGTGLDEVVAAVDPALAQQATADLANAVAKLSTLADLQATGKPIDVILVAPDGSPERTAMLEAIQALKRFADDIERAASALGLSVELEEPSQTL